MRDLYIAGVGVHLPKIVEAATIAQNGWASASEMERYGLTGCAVAGDVPAPELALRAARQAVRRAGVEPADIDTVLYASTWHQGPDGWNPHSYIQRHLTGGDCLAVEIRQGCNGALSALELAAARISAGPAGRAALVVAAENVGTPLVDRYKANPGFFYGDGGSALVLTDRPGFAQLLGVRSVSLAEYEELHRSGEPLFPPGITVGARIDFGRRFQDYVKRNGVGIDVPGRIAEAIGETVKRVLADAGIGLSDVDRVATINGERAFIEEKLLAPLGLPLSASTWRFGAGIGHVAASDQFIAFEHLMSTGQLGAGDHLLMIGTGPGIGIAAAVIRVLESPVWDTRR